MPAAHGGGGEGATVRGGGCAWFVDSFDARYSRCAVMDLDSAANRLLGLAKRASYHN